MRSICFYSVTGRDGGHRSTDRSTVASRACWRSVVQLYRVAVALTGVMDLER
jgi:hypothetical protein